MHLRALTALISSPLGISMQAMAVDLSRLNMELPNSRGFQSRRHHEVLVSRQPCFDVTSESSPSSTEDEHQATSSRPQSESSVHLAAANKISAASNLADGPKNIQWHPQPTAQSSTCLAGPGHPFAARLCTPERRACNRIQANKAPPSPNDPELCTNLRKSALLRSMLSRAEESARHAPSSPQLSRLQPSAAVPANSLQLDSDAMSMSQRSMSMSVSYDIDQCDQDEEVQS